MKKEYPTYKLSTPFFKSGLLDLFNKSSVL